MVHTGKKFMYSINTYQKKSLRIIIYLFTFYLMVDTELPKLPFT